MEKENLQIYHAFCYCQSNFYFIFNFFDFKNLAKFSNKLEKLVEFTLEKKLHFFFQSIPIAQRESALNGDRFLEIVV